MTNMDIKNNIFIFKPNILFFYESEYSNAKLL